MDSNGWHKSALILLIGLLTSMFGYAGTVSTIYGSITGTTINGVEQYLGIPYAQAPTGPLRWKSPKAPRPWRGTLQADSFKNHCAQIGTYYLTTDVTLFDKVTGSEDCLFINVWTPTKQTGPLPVIVFIHGGAGVFGSSALEIYNGERLARELGAVIVTFNYRLGYLGQLHTPLLAAKSPEDASGNFTQLDQIAALKWVRNNIIAFNGDPTHTTAMGHSSGCINLYSLLDSPVADGLFDKLICLSGIKAEPEPEKVFKSSDSYLNKALNGKRRSQEALYKLSSSDIVEAGRGAKVLSAYRDGTIFISGYKNKSVRSVLLGQSGNEAGIFFIKQATGLGEEGFYNLVNNPQATKNTLYRSTWAEAIYKIKKYVGRPITERWIEKSALALSSENKDVYRYVLEWNKQPSPWAEELGPYHGMDVPIIFGTYKTAEPAFSTFSFRDAQADEVEQLHKQFLQYIGNFINTGDPGYGRDIDWPKWNNTAHIKTID